LSDQLNFELSSNSPPTAIFATSDLLAVQVLRELQARSLRIPEKMALISFDDFDAATLVRPTVTVVQQPTVELGRRAASQLLSRLNKCEVPEFSQIVLPTELIIRESCGCGKQLKAR
jgi:DNA-binding LacI/PurR family transcriptional regulator